MIPPDEKSHQHWKKMLNKESKPVNQKNTGQIPPDE